MALEMHPSLTVHAGDFLKTEVVEPHGITVKDLARHLGVSRQGLSNLLHGHAALTGDMALRFEKAFGISADVLMRMHLAYEIAQLRAHENEIDVVPLAKAA